MTISFVGSASAEATSLTLPAHQAGDMIVIFARGASFVAAPTGHNWIWVANRNASSHQTAVAYKIASSASEQSGTWTNADILMTIVLRHGTELIGFAGANVSNGSNQATLSYPTNLANGGNTSGYQLGKAILFGVVTSNTSTVENAPAGFTLRENVVSASSLEAALFDSDAQVSSFTTASVALGVTASYQSYSVVVLATGAAKSAGGGMIVHPGMSGGMRG